MKSLYSLSILFLLFFHWNGFSQENYTINGQNYSLYKEVEGTLTLLWNTIDGQYHFFAKKGDAIVELVNTNQNGKYQEEYKQTLASLTSDKNLNVDKIKLTTGSLTDFFNQYNQLSDSDYVAPDKSVHFESRLGAFVGISNNTATHNPENVFAPYAGIVYELTGDGAFSRHGIIVDFRYSFPADKYDLTYGQFGLEYRFKFIHNETLSVFAQARLLTFTFSKLDKDNPEGLQNLNSTSLQTPIGLGLGMDYKLCIGYLTLSVNNLFAPGYDTNGEFPLDVSLGYKFRL